MEPESERFSAWPRFPGRPEDWARLVETIVAMANTSGGRIVLAALDCEPAHLEAARLDLRVNEVAGPPVHGLESVRLEGGGVEIRVPESDAKPHLFQATVVPSGNGGAASFHAGQIQVRHGARNQPATPADLERMHRRRLARLLDELKERVLHAESPLALSDADGVPVRFSDEPGALAVVPDVDKAYPYTARTLGEALGRGQNWAAAAIECLGLKGHAEYWFATKGARAYAVQRYSERAAERLREKLAQEPDWNPFAELRARGLRPMRRRRRTEER